MARDQEAGGRNPQDAAHGCFSPLTPVPCCLTPVSPMPIFDRYLLRRYWHVFAIAFLSLFGLYFVMDVFQNVNDFFDMPLGTMGILEEIFWYYTYRGCYLFNVIGGSMEVVAAMVALALVQKHGELNPILSAGVSTFRLMRPLLIGAALVNVLIVLNQEFIVPRIAIELQTNAGTKVDSTYNVVPVRDFETDITIRGKRLNLKQQTIEEAEFQLVPSHEVTSVTEKLTTISAKEAIPLPAKGNRRGGWRLKKVSQKYDALQLTEAGRKVIRPVPGVDEDLFILTDVGFDRLYNQDTHYEYLSTWELMRRIKNPSFSHRSIQAQRLYLHGRLTKPLLNLIVVVVGVPFVVRRESVSLVANLATCSGVLTGVLGINELLHYLGKAALLTPETAVWAPIVICGSGAAWLTGLVRT